MGLYDDLLPKTPAPEPQKKKGFFAGVVDKVKGVFGGKKEEPKPAAPAIAVRESSIFKDLVPAGEPAAAPAKRSYGRFEGLIPEKTAAPAEPEESVLGRAYGAYQKQIERKSMSLFAGLLEGGGGMVRSVQWLGDRLVGDPVVQKESAKRLADDLENTDLQRKALRKRLEENRRAGKDSTRLISQMRKLGMRIDEAPQQRVPLVYAKGYEPKPTPLYPQTADTKGTALKIQELARRGAEIVRESAGITQENQTFSEKAVEGLGSSLPYFVPGVGIARVAEAAAVAPRYAMLFGNVAASSLEAMAEAGQVYDTVKNQKGESAAVEASNRTFLANAILLMVTERLGIFNPDVKNLLKRALVSMPTEGLQEGVQQMVQNKEEGRPLWDGVLEAGAIGAVVGGVLGPAAGLSRSNTPTQIFDRDKTNAPSMFKDLVPEKPSDIPAVQGEIERGRGLGPIEEKPATPERAVELYRTVVEQRMRDGKPAVVGADDMKDYFGRDYETARHQVYSRAAFQLFEDMVKTNPDPKVVLLGGGPGSGKSETIVSRLSEQGFKGLVYDSNLANLEGAEKQIKLARDAGKSVEIYGVLPNVDMAGRFAASREQETGRAVSPEAFAKGHVGFPTVLRSLIERGLVKPEDVHIIDARKARTFADAIKIWKNAQFISDPLAAIKDIAYNADDVKKAYDRAKRYIQKQGGGQSVRRAPREDRPDSEDAGRGEGETTGRGVPPTQRERVEKAVEEGPKSIKDVAKETGILEPNVRRILGVGAKAGVFERVEKGVYILRTKDKDIAFVHTADALETLPKLADEGFKADMVFLDIPYNAAGNRGGNRFNEEKGTLYGTITPEQFSDVLASVKRILPSENAPVIYMFSQSRSSAEEMKKYTDKFAEHALKPVARGNYRKTYKDGRAVKFGQYTLEPEGIIVFSESGKLARELGDLDFTFVRPAGYKTEKAEGLLDALIGITTEEGAMVLDPFAGSGVTGASAIKLGRRATLIEKNKEAVEEHIKPRLKRIAKEAEKTRISEQEKMREKQKENGAVEIRTRAISGYNFGGEQGSVEWPESMMSQRQDAIREDLFKKGYSLRANFVRETRVLNARKDRKEGVYTLTAIPLPEWHRSVEKYVDYYIDTHAYPSVSGLEGFIAANRVSQLSEEEIIAEYKKREPDLRAEIVRESGLTHEEAAKKSIDSLAESSNWPPSVVLRDIVAKLENRGLSKEEAERIASKAMNGREGEFATEKKTKKDEAENKLPPLNSGGSVASIGSYRTGEPINIRGFNTLKSIEFPEFVDLARELMGTVPKIRQKVSRKFGGIARGLFAQKKPDGEIRLRADLFDPSVTSPDQAAKVLAHEIGHLIDWLPDKTLSRGNLLGRLAALKGFRSEFYAAAGISRSADSLRDQMWELSKYWRPLSVVDPTTSVETPISEEQLKELSPRFLEYRQSAMEVYADFVSALFNDPELVNKMAPEAFNIFFEQLDKKPAVKDAYFSIQALMSGDRAELIKHRREGVHTMFKEGDIKAVDLQKQKEQERDARRRDVMRSIKFNLIDKNFPMIERVRSFEKKGEVINPDDNPIYYLEERNYLGGRIKAFLERDIVPIYQELLENDMSWETFGEALFYDRIIAGDRSTQANPRGITSEAAQELRDSLSGSLTEKQKDVLNRSATAFRKSIKDVTEEAHDEGLYSDELFKITQKNAAYVTYQVIEHIEDGMSSKVYKSIGTLKDITNPADASILKIIATIRAIERNKVARTSVDFLKKAFPEDIKEADTVFTGRAMRPIESKDVNEQLIFVMRKGKLEGYYVDPYIASSIRNESIAQNKAVLALMEPIAYPNRILFRPVFIGFNLGFQAFNFVRDFRRFWKNIPEMTIARAFRLYFGPGYRLARVRAFGPKVGGGPQWDEAVKDLQKLEDEKVFSITFSELFSGHIDEDTQIERILQYSGINTFSKPARNRFFAPFLRILETIQDLGSLIETIPKAAGFYHLANGKELTTEQKSYIRRYLGSPDFLAGGFAKPMSNELFLFSNAITQGIRSDIEIATGPKTRAAYWWKTAKIDLLPKVFMLMASLGLFGDWLDELFGGVSEYDKTNYTIVPLGQDENGKTIYVRIPHDETGRFIGGLFWKIISALDPDDESRLGTSLAELFSFTGGQVPSITPVVSTLSIISQYLAGINPYDSFRGQPILSDEVFKAGGFRANKEVAGWVFNNLGGGIFMRYSPSFRPDQKSGVEQFFQMPVGGNIIGRFVRVSDYGQIERLREIRANVEQDEARRRLSDNEIVNAAIKEALAKEDLKPFERRPYELNIVEQVFPDRPKSAADNARARRLIQKFRLGVVRGQGDPLINALIDSSSNEQKAAIIRDIRDGMTDEEYRAFKREAIQNDAASADAFGLAERS